MGTDKVCPFEPEWVVAPGEVLSDNLAALGMDQKELALRAGRSTKHINQIIQGKAPITPETALVLERVVGVPARLWLNLEATYQADRARIEHAHQVKREAQRAKDFPYAQMAKLGWVPATRKGEEKVHNLLSFLGVASLDQVQRVCEGTYRIAKVHQPCNAALAAWVRKGELDARGLTTGSFDAKAIKAALPELRALSRRPKDAFDGGCLQTMCMEFGIALVFVPHLQGTYAHGYVRWLAPDRALIQLSLRLKRDDVVWFSFFHELGHLLLHGKRQAFVESDSMDKTEKEREANQFAQNTLIPPCEFEKLGKRPTYSRAGIVSFAQDIGVSAGIVVGRLHHEGLLPQTHLNDLRQALEW